MSLTQSLDDMADAVEACHRSFARSPATADSASVAISLFMHAFVVLVSQDTNVARHLVERDAFMPLLFTLLRSGAPYCCPAGQALRRFATLLHP